MADLLNAADPDEIMFGPNMTTLTFTSAGRSPRRCARRRDRGDQPRPRCQRQAVGGRGRGSRAHGPVRRHPARRLHARPRRASTRPSRAAEARRGRLGVQRGRARSTRSPNRPRGPTRPARWSFVDAVHSAPHCPIDVQAVGTAIFSPARRTSSSARTSASSGAGATCSSAAGVQAASRPTTGWRPARTNHEGIAGSLAAVEYLAEVGRRFGAPLRRFPA